MKSSIVAAANMAMLASAFPHFAMDHLTKPIAADVAYKRSLQSRQTSAAPQGAGFLPLTPPPFSASAQYVNTTGAHAFVPPASGDARGECPGLNALANHNYLPHNGVATIQQFVDATTEVFGMGEDLALFLATYGAIVDGDLISWSIEGGPHVGIGGSHGNYESDSSPFKSDLNQYGSNEKLIIEQFTNFYNMQPDANTANYNLAVLSKFRDQRFQESIDKNPLFTYAPFTGILVSQAAFTFIYRFMANHSAEYSEGMLNRDVLKSFMSVTGEPGSFKWTKGHEKIPDNWYHRDRTVDSYTIPYFQTDVNAFALEDLQVIDVGCNHNAVDTYNSIDAATLSNGAYTASQAVASPVCFSLSFLSSELPGLTGLSSSSLSPLTKVISSATTALKCAAMPSVNMTALTACPGFTFYGGPTGPVAAGAVQS